MCEWMNVFAEFFRHNSILANFMKKKPDKRKVIRIKWISKDFRCNIERESAGISYLAAGILICLSSCLSNTSEPLGSFCSVSLPLFFRESMSQATAIREGNHIPSHCPKLDQNITSTTYWVAKTRAVLARYVNHPIELLFFLISIV